MFKEKMKSGELYKGILAVLYFPFLAALIFCSLSGAYIFARPSLDFYRYFIMKYHVVLGFFAFWAFFPLSFFHLKKLYGMRLLLITFLSALCFYFPVMLEVWPPLTFIASAILLLILLALYFRDDRTSGKASIISGVLAWAFLNVVLSTGMYVGFPLKAFRTDMYNTLHKIFGLLSLPFIFYHLFIRLSQWVNVKTCLAAAGIAAFNMALFLYGFKQAGPPHSSLHYWVALYGIPFLFFSLLFRLDARLTRKKALAFLFIISINTGLFVTAFKNAGWFQTHRAAKNGSGYSLSIPPSAPFSAKNSKTCGEVGCHTEIYKQWRASTHRFSATNLAYQKVFELFVKETGKQNAAFCEKCHNPDTVIFEAESKDPGAREFFTGQGVSCLSCHLISENDVKTGNGFKSVKIDAPYLPGFHPKNKKEWEMLHYFIRTDLRQHRKNYQRRPFYQKPEYCVTCHRVTVPAEVNGGKDFLFEGPYASWKDSRYAKEGITCQHCHMQLFEFHDPQSIERHFHARPDHRTFGLNASLAFYIPDEAKRRVKQKELDAFSKNTQKWLRGELIVPDYEQWFLRYARDGRATAYSAYFKGKRVLDMTLLAENLTRGKLVVKTKNARAGHDFPVSLLDMVDVWLEVAITDANGRVIFKSGAADKNGALPPDTRRLGAVYVDKDGNEIDRHRVWRTTAVKKKRVIPPDKEIQDVFTVRLPSDAATPLTVSARWLYRRANPEFSRWLFDNPKKTFPVIEIASVEETLN